MLLQSCIERQLAYCGFGMAVECRNEVLEHCSDRAAWNLKQPAKFCEVCGCKIQVIAWILLIVAVGDRLCRREAGRCGLKTKRWLSFED